MKSWCLPCGIQEDQYPEDTIIKDRLLASILNNETIVTEGAGLYYYTNANQRVAVETNEIYSYKSDAYSNVNNYVNINDKLWRIIRANYNVDRGSYSYELIEDEMTNNVISGYSTISDSNGYYNSLFDSTLVNTVGNSIYYQTPFSYYYTPYYPIYVESGDLLSDYSEEHFKPTIEVFDVFHASTDVNCSYSTLATGGCQSWLTNNGNTFLASKVYSDESTNTGKIAYLKDGKVIAVDPQDTNYGNYKTFYFTGQDCDFLVLNAGVADGSRNNPYTISTSCSDLCSCDV